MSCIVYRTNKKTGVVYAYRSESYRDPITKKPKSKRTYLGRVDPETKEIVLKAEDGKRNRSKLGEHKTGEPTSENDNKVIKEQREIIEQQREELESLKKQVKENNKLLMKLKDTLTEACSKIDILIQ